MSKLRVSRIENATTTDGGIDIDTSGHVQVDGVQMPTAGPLSNRNLIINGDMQVAQRGTSAFTGGGVYPIDRFVTNNSTAGVVTSQQEGTVLPVGFKASVKLSVTTADATIDAADHWSIQQHIEGYSVQGLEYGTANAKAVTVSFWVRSSVTGTFCLILLGSSDGSTLNSSYVSEYSISSADTWEYKTVTVPGPTSGTFTTNSGRGLTVRFGLTAGSSQQQAAGSWGTTNATGSANQTQLLQTLNATFYLTGVQVEIGEKATPFEHKNYGDTLRLCKRYYQKAMCTQGNNAQDMFLCAFGGSAWFQYIPHELGNMRAMPTLSLENNANVQFFSQGGAWTASTVTIASRGIWPQVHALPFGTGDTGANNKLVRKTTAGALLVVMDAEL